MKKLPIKKHFKIQVWGNVYKVGFRFLAMTKAYEKRISGIVRNEHDGSLYIEAEGIEVDLSSFVDWCKQGPPGSKVEEVKVEEGELNNYESFDML